MELYFSPHLYFWMQMSTWHFIFEAYFVRNKNTKKINDETFQKSEKVRNLYEKRRNQIPGHIFENLENPFTIKIKGQKWTTQKQDYSGILIEKKIVNTVNNICAVHTMIQYLHFSEKCEKLHNA